MLASSPSPSSAALRSGTGSHYEHSTQFNSPRSSRLAIEELRSALNRHTVDPTSPESPNLRRRASASTSALTATCTLAPSAESFSRRPSTSSATSTIATPATSAPSVPPPAPTAPPLITPANPQPAASLASMPAPDTAGSNKRNSQSDHRPAEATSADKRDPNVEASQTKRLRPAAPDVKILPAKYENANVKDLVLLISSMLMELIRFNNKIPLNHGRLTRFHSRTPPRISVQEYLQRLTTHATLSPPILLSMVFYIDRLCALYPAFTVSSLTIHRFLIASATVASKGLSDSFWTNKTYARVGGISMQELAMLEMEFLFRVQWRIVPEPEVLVDYYQSLVERCDDFEIERIPSAPAITPTSTTTTPAA